MVFWRRSPVAIHTSCLSRQLSPSFDTAAGTRLETRGGDGGSTHEQTARDLTTHLGDLVFADPGLHEVGDEKLKPVRRARVACLAEIGRQHKVLIGPHRTASLGCEGSVIAGPASAARRRNPSLPCLNFCPGYKDHYSTSVGTCALERSNPSRTMDDALAFPRSVVGEGWRSAIGTYRR